MTSPTASGSDMNRSLSISREDVLRILSALETTVVSVDRIGSSLPAERQPQQLFQFAVEQRIFHQLAEARQVLWKACDTQLDAAQRKKLEKELDRVPRWEAEDAAPAASAPALQVSPDVSRISGALLAASAVTALVPLIGALLPAAANGEKTMTWVLFLVFVVTSAVCLIGNLILATAVPVLAHHKRMIRFRALAGIGLLLAAYGFAYFRG
jgi:hypothetical protein